VPRSEIALSIQCLLDNDSIVTAPELPDAIVRYATANIDFADCVLAARAAATGRIVASFDRDYRKFDDMKAMLPRELLADIVAALS